MNKQKDLMNVFNFLAEYLREEPVINEPVINPVVDEPVGVTKEIKKPMVLDVDKDGILDLMRKVDEIQKVKTTFDEPLMRKFIPEDQRDLEEKPKVEPTSNETK